MGVVEIMGTVIQQVYNLSTVTHKEVLQTVIKQLAFALAISFVVSTQLKPIVHDGLNSTDWSSVPQDVSVETGRVNVWLKVVLVMSLHLSYLCCYALMPIRKISTHTIAI